MSITYTSAASILNLGFNSDSWIPPGTWYLGLITNPTEAGVYTELNGVNYARVAVNNTATAWTDTSTSGPMSKTNTAIISFPESGAGGWTPDPATHIGFFDTSARNTGVMWFYDSLTTSISIPENTTVYFAVGGITISMSN